MDAMATRNNDLGSSGQSIGAGPAQSMGPGMDQNMAPDQGAEADATLTQLDILIKLYEGAINFLEKSIVACDDGRVDDFKALLQRGRLIIEEFQKTLDFERGGQVPTQLNDLYVFMLDSLTQADLTHDTEYVDRVIEHLRILLDGWQGAKSSGTM